MTNYTHEDIKAEEKRMQEYWEGAKDNGSDTVKDAQIRGYKNLRDVARESNLPEDTARLEGIVQDLKSSK